jgi:hypothetical protein
MYAMLSLNNGPELPNLELKTWPKRFEGSLSFVFVFPAGMENA